MRTIEKIRADTQVKVGLGAGGGREKADANRRLRADIPDLLEEIRRLNRIIQTLVEDPDENN